MRPLAILFLSAGLLVSPHPTPGGGSAWAQVEAVTVPRGAVRFEMSGEFRNFDSRFNRGATEILTEDFRRQAIGGEFFPALLEAEGLIGGLAGVSSYEFNIGRTGTQGDANLGTLGLGLAVGVTNRLTLFGSVPVVRQRMQTSVAFSGQVANAGFNPSDPVFGDATGQQQAALFFSDFDAALVALATNIVTGQYDADPALLALANQMLGDATSMRDDLRLVIADMAGASPFLPLASSQAGTAILNRIADLQTTLDQSLGVTGFTSAPPLPSAPMTQADYISFAESPAGPVRVLSLAESKSFLLGDIEVGASYQLLDRWQPAGPGARVRAYATLAARLPTGTRPLPDDVLGLGNGDRQPDIALDLTADLAVGRLGTRLVAGYTQQFATTFVTRVSIPSRPIPYADRETRVRLDPGNVVRLGVRPFIAITPTFAIQAAVTHWARGEDTYTFASASDSLAGISATELAAETKANATVVGGGITYVSPSVNDPSRRGLPVEAHWIYEGVVRAGGGRVPKAKTVRMGLRLYFRLWGGGA